MSATLKSCLFSVALQLVLCAEGSYHNDVNVIRIQNNGSQIRTIYLPKHSWNTSYNTQKYYKRISSPVDGNKLVLVNNFGKHKSQSENHNRFTKNVAGKQNIPDNVNHLKYTVKIQKINSSDLEYGQSPIKRRKKIHPRNNTIWPSKKAGVEFKVNADKFAKLLNIFTIVNFTNELCQTEEGMVGVCYHPSECQSLGGESHGSCAQGFGVCCVVVRTCGESSTVNDTYITSSSVSQDPDSGVYVCTITIYKTIPGVVQLRLFFEKFQLAGPVEGNCVVDRFIVTGQNRNYIIPPICGFNTGKHVYIDVDEAEGPVSLTLLSSGAHGVPRGLRVRVTQLTMDHPLLAPHNCLQYFTETQGTIESFNYVPPVVPPSHGTTGFTPGYFNNLNYAICFKKSADLCGIVYWNATDGGMEYTFEMVNMESDGTSTVPEGHAGAGSFDCPDDYISTSTIRLCGFKLNDGSFSVDYTRNYPVSDNTNGPLILRVHTNHNVTGRGFHLGYMLTPCYSHVSGPSGGTLTATGQSVHPAATRSPYVT